MRLVVAGCHAYGGTADTAAGPGSCLGGLIGGVAHVRGVEEAGLLADDRDVGYGRPINCVINPSCLCPCHGACNSSLLSQW